MFTLSNDPNASKADQYATLVEQARALVESERDLTDALRLEPGEGESRALTLLRLAALAKNRGDVAELDRLIDRAEAAAKVGIPLDPAYSGRQGRTSGDFVGVALTYAGVAANPLTHRIRTERFNTTSP